MEQERLEIDNIMRKPCVREIVSCLVGHTRAVCLGGRLSRTQVDQELSDAIALLIDKGWIVPQADAGLLEQEFVLISDPALLKAITEAMLDFEREMIAKRAGKVSLHAAEKLRAIDSLAESVFAARRSVRKDADIL